MPEERDGKKIFSLLEVANSIKRTLEDRYKSSFWLKAEMNKLNLYPNSGHCYPALVQKENGVVIAEMKATMWKSDYERINTKFKSYLNEGLKDGIELLICARISFEPKFGLALHIVDIDPAFTLGEMERERLETINRLKEESLFTRNKQLSFPVLPKRIAIISVDTSKGYNDFITKLDKNPWGYKFFHFLFPSILQGDKAVETICRQLKQVDKVKHHFDVVAIVRGGGGDVGLACYNNYELNKAIATFPIPVITGIGHSTNETVAEMISHKNCITPTDLADFIIQKFHNFSVPVKEAEDKLKRYTSSLLGEYKKIFTQAVRNFKADTNYLLSENTGHIKLLKEHLNRHSGVALNRERSIFSTLVKDFKFETTRMVSSGKSALESASAKLNQGTRNFNSVQHGMLRNSTTVIRKDCNAILTRGFFQVEQVMREILRCTSSHIKEIQFEVGELPQKIRIALSRNLLQEKTFMQSLERNVELLSPEKVLKRGYSITLVDGKAITDSSSLEPGTDVKTILLKGSFESTVTEINIKDHESAKQLQGSV